MFYPIDICMTAALRPTILERTLKSIKQNLIWPGGFQLIVDIAPVGERQFGATYMATIIKKYFENTRIRSLPDSPQAAALKWTWEKAESPYVLQWEDDWVLEMPVYLEEVISEMSQEIGIMCFDRVGKSVLTYGGYAGQVKPKNEIIWLRTKGKSLGGPPSLMRHAYIRQALELIDGSRCLDTMSHDEKVINLFNKWQVAIYLGADGRGELVQDIGKQWKEQQGIIMKKNTARGVTWIQK